MKYPSRALTRTLRFRHPSQPVDRRGIVVAVMVLCANRAHRVSNPCDMNVSVGYVMGELSSFRTSQSEMARMADDHPLAPVNLGEAVEGCLVMAR